MKAMLASWLFLGLVGSALAQVPATVANTPAFTQRYVATPVPCHSLKQT